MSVLKPEKADSQDCEIFSETGVKRCFIIAIMQDVPESLKTVFDLLEIGMWTEVDILKLFSVCSRYLIS